MNDNEERTSVIMTIRRNINYQAITPRVIRGKWLNGFIKIDEKEKAKEVFEFFCTKLQDGAEIKTACKKAKRKFNISLTVEECKAKTFSQQKPTYEVYVG